MFVCAGDIPSSAEFQNNQIIRKGHILRIYARNISIFTGDIVLPDISAPTFQEGLISLNSGQYSDTDNSDDSESSSLSNSVISDLKAIKGGLILAKNSK